MRKGFAVFSPLVGTIVVILAMLIVASILQSEKVNIAGTLHSYRSAQMADIATEVQGRVVEDIRETIITEIEQPQVMAIKVIDCPSDALLDEGILDYSDDEIAQNDPAHVCWAKTVHEVNATAYNRLVGVALLRSSIENTIRRIISKYELTKINYLDPPLERITGDIELVECSTFDECDDGRIRVNLDFSALSDTPIAEVTSATKTLRVFLPAVKKEYTTNEPYGLYATMTADLFQDFQLLNESWHYAGSEKDHDPRYLKTDGSEWYHYNYAVQNRTTGTESPNEYATEWNPGFLARTRSLDFGKGETLRDYILDTLKGQVGPYLIAGDEDKPYTSPAQVMRLDNAEEELEDLALFDSGVFTSPEDTAFTAYAA
ncbi:MAG: hypothetical protein JW834_03910, partial [Candidatus Diapherotrites archaeon]|nr:hypothetical protein [Candidatus Diapherotrites archaeon]